MNVGGSERRGGGGGEEDSSADTTAAALETPRDDMRRAAAELQKRTEELEASVAEEEAALARARELRDALEARRDALLAQQRSGPGESALAAAQRRNTELRAENTQLKRTLLRFLNRYYPRPAPQPSRTRDDATPVPMKTLREIVQVCVWCLGGSDDDENDDGDDEKKNTGADEPVHECRDTGTAVRAAGQRGHLGAVHRAAAALRGGREAPERLAAVPTERPLRHWGLCG